MKPEGFLNNSYDSQLRHIMVEQSPDGILIINPDDLGFYDFNTAAYTMHGFTREEFSQLKVYDLDISGKTTQDQERTDLVMAGEIVSFETTHSTASGGLIYLHVTVQAIEVQETRKVHATWRNITSQKESEELLRKSEEKYRRIFENIQDTYYEATFEGVLIEVSPSIENLSQGQYKRADLIGRSLVDFYAHIEERHIFLDKILKNGYISDYEFHIINKDGTVVPCSISSKIQLDAEGTPEKIIGTLRNIEDRKNTENKLARQTAELQELNAMKDKFFSIIAHDLRSPFTVISGFTELLLNKISSIPLTESKAYLELIHSSAKQTVYLLENLLLWSTTQSGNIDFQPGVFKVSDALEGQLQLMNIQAFKKGIKLTSTITNEPEVLADKNMVNTILRNLLTNAIKYTPRGGTIGISARPTVLGALEISVEDNGIGIPGYSLESIFQITSKQATPGTENEKGSGFGLILCKEFVEKNGGRIWVESQFGSGSIFRFTLPLAK